MHKPTLVLVALALSLPLVAGCDDAGVSPEEVCAHAEHFAGEEAAQHGGNSEQARKEAHRACVDGEAETQKRVGNAKWGKYSRCMVGKKSRAEQEECRQHTR